MAIDDLYEADFLLWTERQAAELRGLAKSRRDLPYALDLEHVAEEIEDLGRSELNAVSSLLRNLLIHLIKFAASPHTTARAHWADEIMAFHDDLRTRYAPAMRQRVDMDEIWTLALRRAGESLRRHAEEAPEMIPSSCPFSLADLLDEGFDLERLAARLQPRN